MLEQVLAQSYYFLASVFFLVFLGGHTPKIKAFSVYLPYASLLCLYLADSRDASTRRGVCAQ